MPKKTLAELSATAVSLIANLNFDSDDEALAQRILAEADPLFVEELGRALCRQRLVLWVQAERRRLQRRLVAKQKAG